MNWNRDRGRLNLRRAELTVFLCPLKKVFGPTNVRFEIKELLMVCGWAK